MQTKKKIDVRNGPREKTSPKFARNQKKMTVETENKVTELITSSARKQKSDVPFSKKNEDTEATNIPTGHKVSLDERANEIDDQMDTIFSPAFHLTKDFCGSMPRANHELMEILDNKGEIDHENHVVRDSDDGNYVCHATLKRQQQNSRKDVVEHIRLPTDSSTCLEKSDAHNICNDLPNSETSVNPSGHEQCKITGNLSSEVSAIYLAMQNSKLECIDEPTQDMDADEGDDFDDFDPYLFIKNLPDLSAVVPTFRPMLLPKQTRSCPSTTLVLDLDETLVHSSLEPREDADFTFPVNFNLKEHTVYVRCRPYLKDFMERVASLFEIIIFTASQSIYAEQLLNVLDPKRRLFRHRVYRESCVFVDGNYLKDLSVLGRDLARVIIIDNSPQAFGFQVDNGIPIESWFDDRSDQALLSLLPFLESLVGVDDVRPMIAKKFNLRDKIAAAAYPSLVFSR